MKILLLTVGKPRLAYARAGVAEYLARLRRGPEAEWKQIKEGSRGVESTRLWEASEGSFRILLDERGQLCGTRDLQLRWQKWEQSAVRQVAFLIGGADGHEESLRQKADWIWSLSPLTLQHELALVVLLEQLYRVQSLQRGEPYHRD